MSTLSQFFGGNAIKRIVRFATRGHYAKLGGTSENYDNVQYVWPGAVTESGLQFWRDGDSTQIADAQNLNPNTVISSSSLNGRLWRTTSDIRIAQFPTKVLAGSSGSITAMPSANDNYFAEWYALPSAMNLARSLLLPDDWSAFAGTDPAAPSVYTNPWTIPAVLNKTETAATFLVIQPSWTWEAYTGPGFNGYDRYFVRASQRYNLVEFY